MEKSASLGNLAKAIIAVMKAVKGIEKTMDVGSGNSSYKGVSDQVVKQIIGKAMEENGLCILPIDIQAKTQVDRWDEVDPWSKSTPKDLKSKQSVFTEVTTKYLLLHESGESMELSGYGHGVDPQDKGAGKATTYALKYTLLYTFLVPTGKIDDADNNHSDSHETPPARQIEDNPFKKVYKTAAGIEAVLDKVTTVGQLGALFSTNEAFIKQAPDVLAKFTAKKATFQTQQQPA